MLLHKQALLNAKNLLAFSAGVDSSALLFLLLENNIEFDIAIVNYGVREQSKLEVAYAQELAKKYNFHCFVLNATQISKNFEAEARAIRYDFFQELIEEHHYTNLLTAHHLGDRFEWMLMQFCKGAGCVELSGMKAVDKHQNYTLLRPLLHLDKQELLRYLITNKIRYFEDESNEDESYKRNEFRHNFAKPLLSKYLEGIKKSFEYIDEDISLLVQDIELKISNDLAYFKKSSSQRSNLVTIDKYFKSISLLITANEKQLLKNEKTVVISRKYVVSQALEYVFITPYLEDVKMSKKFKEKMRLLKIEPKLRAYFSTDEESVLLVSRLLQ